jgi:hypothetical protein
MKKNCEFAPRTTAFRQADVIETIKATVAAGLDA